MGASTNTGTVSSTSSWSTMTTSKAPGWPQTVDVASFIEAERPIALQGALNNIGPDGSGAAGASAGFVVASPSKTNPDCESSQERLSARTGTHGQSLTTGRLLYLDSRLSLDAEDGRGRVRPGKRRSAALPRGLHRRTGCPPDRHQPIWNFPARRRRPGRAQVQCRRISIQPCCEFILLFPLSIFAGRIKVGRQEQGL